MGRIPVVGIAALLSLATVAIAQQPSSAAASGPSAPASSPSAAAGPSSTRPAPATTPAPSPATTLATATKAGASAAATWTVEVGKGDHRFTPEVVQANPGDTIDFRFFPTNHSVIRAEYQYPCIPYEMTGRGKVGFWSGFKAVDAILDDPPSYTIKINDTLPIFFYCSAPGSCIDYQMVGVINPNSSVSLQKQKEVAKQAKYQLSPGENFPDEAASKSMSSVYATGASGSGYEATAKPTNSGSENKGSHHLSAGAIAGIAIGAAAVLVLAAALFFYMGRTKKLEDHVAKRSSTAPMGGDQGAAAGAFGANPDYRHSQMTSNTYPAPPYDQKEGYPDGALSPRSAAMSPSPRAPFEEFGGVHQSPIDRPQSVEVDGTGHQPPKQAGPVEMYAPLK